MTPLEYTCDLVRFNSVSLLSNVEVTDYVERTLRGLEFETERLEYDDANGVRKVSVVGKKGTGTGGVAYFGHTDVVPADDWMFTEQGPFQPTVREDRLYGRGSCDMKGSVACMLAAAARFPAGELRAPLYITCTADEEVGYHGAKQVAAESRLFREMVAGAARGIIGEPTRLEVVYAHKGVTGFVATSRGRAAHSSTSHGVNANLKMIPFLVEMKAIHDELLSDPHWRNNEFDPPTISWNIGINDHTRAVNITPPQSVCTVYLRPMPGQDVERLLARVRRAADECGLAFELRTNAPPLYMDPQSPFVRECVTLAGRPAAQTVAYGTDGCMFGDLEQMVVLGPGDIAQAHTHDEWIALAELERGADLYARLIRNWCM